ncbi:MAG: guanine deaminase, partial [Curvibacter sp.]
MNAYRASLLWFAPRSEGVARALYEQDGLLVVGPDAQGRQVVQAIGAYSTVSKQYPQVPVQHFPGRIIAPGFIDLHIHYPQIDVIGSPASGLLPWLENYTFPTENRFSAPDHSAQAATFFIAELLRNGVTTALTFATSHPESVNALFTEAQARHMRLITGLVLMDRHAPDYLVNQGLGSVSGTEQSLRDTESLIQRWHGVDRLGYAITPRFAPTSTDAQLRGAGELAKQYADVWIQSHVAENKDEITWARELFPASRSYLATYDDFGLMRERAIYAHCIHFDDDDRALMRDTGAAAA